MYRLLWENTDGTVRHTVSKNYLQLIYMGRRMSSRVPRVYLIKDGVILWQDGVRLSKEHLEKMLAELSLETPMPDR